MAFNFIPRVKAKANSETKKKALLRGESIESMIRKGPVVDVPYEERAPQQEGDFVFGKRVLGLVRKEVSIQDSKNGIPISPHGEPTLERMKHRNRITRVSDLVLRKVDGVFYLSAFIYTYTLTQATYGRVHRPNEWVLIDLETGKLLNRFNCLETDFSTEPFDWFYNLNLSSGEYDISSEHYHYIYGILDEVRKGILYGSGGVDTGKYDEYLTAILHNTPEEYKRFFTSLSDPEGQKTTIKRNTEECSS